MVSVPGQMTVETITGILLCKLSYDPTCIVNSGGQPRAHATDIEVHELVSGIPIHKVTLELIPVVVPKPDDVTVIVDATNQRRCGSRILEIGENATTIQKRRCGRVAGSNAVVADDLS